jgi:hypothetical protein
MYAAALRRLALALKPRRAFLPVIYPFVAHKAVAARNEEMHLAELELEEEIDKLGDPKWGCPQLQAMYEHAHIRMGIAHDQELLDLADELGVNYEVLQ